MARWTEERERDRWMGRGDPYGDDERRFRSEREEGGMRARGWRDEDRFGEWRRGERGGEWHGGERGGEWRGSERGGGLGGGGAWGERGREPYGRGEEYGREWYGSERDRGDYTTFGSSSPFPYSRSEYPSAYGRDYPSGYGREYSSGGYGRDYPRGEPVPYGTTTYGPGSERRYGGERGWRGEGGGTFERMGEKIKEGVRKLTGKGPKGYRRSDERVQDEVAERIARSGITSEYVEIRVQNGEVTLTGFVESREDKRDLEDIADDVFGVDEVHNHLRLRRGDQPETAATAGTGTTGTGAAMSGQQTGARVPQQPRTGQQPGQPGRH